LACDVVASRRGLAGGAGGGPKEFCTFAAKRPIRRRGDRRPSGRHCPALPGGSSRCAAEHVDGMLGRYGRQEISIIMFQFDQRLFGAFVSLLILGLAGILADQARHSVDPRSSDARASGTQVAVHCATSVILPRPPSSSGDLSLAERYIRRSWNHSATTRRRDLNLVGRCFAGVRPVEARRVGRRIGASASATRPQAPKACFASRHTPVSRRYGRPPRSRRYAGRRALDY